MLRLPSLVDEGGKREQRHGHHDERQRQCRCRGRGRGRRKRPLILHGGPHREDGRGQQSDACPSGPEPRRRPEQERELKDQRCLRRNRAQGRELPRGVGNVREPGNREPRNEDRRLHRADPRRRSEQREETRSDSDDRRHNRQLRKDVAEQAVEPDSPVGLTDEPPDRSRIEERRHERSDSRSQEQHRQTSQAVEALRRLAEKPDDARRDDGLCAIGEVQRKDERQRPLRRQLRQNVHRQHRQQHEPPSARRHQQKRSRQDGIRRPEDRRRRGGHPQQQTDKTAKVVATARPKGDPGGFEPLFHVDSAHAGIHSNSQRFSVSQATM